MQTVFLKAFVLIGLVFGFAYAEDKAAPEVKPNAEVKSDSQAKPETATKSNEELKGDSGESKNEKKNENGSFSGEVFVLRNGPRTEVFFRKHNQSYFIPKGNKHNSIVKTLQKKAKLNQNVTIEFNPKTREISEVKDSTPETKPGSNLNSNQ